jgi:hypothetical protein
VITVACVRTGDRYGIEYVAKLRDMVARYLPMPHRFICLTDQPETLAGVEMIPLMGLPGWWAKMALFSRSFRGEGRCLYFDLDTVIIGDLTPLAEIEAPFAICANFTRAVNPAYPCRYGSCIMVLADSFGSDIWASFMSESHRFIQGCTYGDQQAIEQLYPDAILLQDVLPAGYLVGRREFTDERPEGAAVMIFAGKHKPHNTTHKWLREAWQ